MNHVREELLSGYLDGELTQMEEQKVRLHLEDCDQCRAVWSEMKTLREVSMSTSFQEPEEEQWGEMPKSPVSRGLRGIGWIFVIIWVVLTAGYGAWQFATGPEDLFGKLTVFGIISGVLLLLVSVGMDRLRDMKTDRYRRISK
ncbi:MAG: zf-HC2 domain-containing protein [Acidobacteriota bacterium]|nr:zf-HC2 domain-containing protein [Acidobacteriota bacterium]